MPVIQVAYEIPEATYAGLLTGQLKRFGSVVRDHRGIIGHLDEVPISEQDYGSSRLPIVKVLKNHKNIAIGIGVVTVVAVAGGLVLGAMKSSKNKKNAEPKMPKCVVDFNNSLCVYLEAVRNGNLDIETIRGLISDLGDVKENYYSGKINIDFSTGQLNTLMDLIFNYTRKLAEANSVEFNGLEEPISASADNTIVNLQHYLEVQKQIFEKVS